MNKFLTLLLVATAAIVLPAHAASPAGTEFPVARIAAKVHANGDSVTTGTSRVLVSARLGAPCEVLPDGSWLYANYVVHTSPADEGHPVSLIVRFKDNRVTQLTLADAAAAVVLRARPVLRDSHPLLAASAR